MRYGAEIQRLLLEGLRPHEIREKLGCAKSSVSYHVKRLGLDFSSAEPIVDWLLVQAFYDEGHSQGQCLKAFNLQRSVWRKAVKRGVLVQRPQAPAKTRSEYNEYMRIKMQEHSMKRRDKAHAYLGGECSRCGSTDQLQVHHKDPAQKSFTLASRWHRPWDELLTELKKCILLCKSCHQAHHKVAYEHGTPNRYWQGCRCQDCRTANTIHQRKYK